MKTIHSPHALGNAIRGRRLDLDLSQADLANRAGVSRKWIIDVEHGKPGVSVGHLLRLLDAVDLDLVLEPRERPTGHDPDARPGGTTVDLDDLLRGYKR